LPDESGVASIAPTEPVTIAVLLTCYNRREHTLACLDSIHANAVAGVSVNVYLVDDASTDGTAEAVAVAYPDVHVSVSSGDLFWGGGMRLAFNRAVPASPDFLLWINDDVTLYPDALARLLIASNAIPAEQRERSIVVGSSRDPITGETTYGGVERTDRLRRMAFSLIEPKDTVQPCETMNGNIVLVPRSVYQILGNIDRRFTHAMGDYDYGLRAGVAGCHVFIAPGHLGTCRLNLAVGSFFDTQLSRRERIRLAFSPKGLPPAQWATLCRRYAGPLWPANALLPYVRMMVQRRR
jgi:GT2 family glycosyltransferase